MSYFDVTMQFTSTVDGKTKKQKAKFLIETETFGDSEQKAFGELGDNERDAVCCSISRSNIKELVLVGDTDLFFKVKVCYSLMDEDTEKEKKVTTYLLVNADNAKEAYERTEEHLKDMLVPFRIPKVEESPICEVFQYEKQAPKGFVLDAKVLNVMMKDGNQTIEWVEQIENGEHEEECAFDEIRHLHSNIHEEACAMDGDAVEVFREFIDGEWVDADPRLIDTDESVARENLESSPFFPKEMKAIDPTDGQAIGFNPMTLESYLEDIVWGIRPESHEPIRELYRSGDTRELMRYLQSRNFTVEQAEMIADLCANDA